MGNINLYKIEEDKNQLFIQEMVEKLQEIDTQVIEKQINGINNSFCLTLYTSIPQNGRALKWGWILTAFRSDNPSVTSPPKAVLMIKKNNTIYAVTFGHAFYLVDKFCDRDFGFNFARKVRFREIKTTMLTSPHSKRNKTVNTYINYNELEFDSGESFAKIKVKADLPVEFKTFKPPLEIGCSIKFSVEQDSLDAVIDLIVYVENILSTANDLYKIPVFSKVVDSELLHYLDDQLRVDIQNNPAKINISELDVIGVTEVFNRNDGEFKIRYGNARKTIPSLNNNEIEIFCNENSLNMSDILLDILVISLQNGTPVRTDKVKHLIDYTNDNEKCILSKGKWYKYNDD